MRPGLLRKHAKQVLHEYNLSWSRDRDVDHQLNVVVLSETFDLSSEDDVDGFLVTSTTGKILEMPDEFPESWLMKIHGFANELFLDIITEKAKKEWGYDANRNS